MWHPVTSLDDVPLGEGREFTVADRVVAVFHVEEEEFVALDGICPHAGGPLGEGRLAGGIVTCPWHGWQFDVRTGQHCLSSQIRQPGFPTRIEGGTLYVELP